MISPLGISGASGFIYGLRLLEILRELDIETHVIVSRAGLLTGLETGKRGPRRSTLTGEKDA